ncbi:MAG TPA: right-handed parallel beta-helix repeat-containing protein, partial [Allosphingosinicella sp.]
ERGTGGHYVKSRAARIEVVESSFDDSAGRTTNYMIDLPNGASGLIAHNAFVQGRDKENYSAFITVASEGLEHDTSGLVVTENEATLVPGLHRRTAFLADLSGAPIRLQANRLDRQIAEFERRQ